MHPLTAPGVPGSTLDIRAARQAPGYPQVVPSGAVDTHRAMNRAIHIFRSV